jgi:hypothetical protein
MKCFAISAPIIGPKRNAKGPAIVTFRAMVLPVPLGAISQLKVIDASGGPAMDTLNARPSKTLEKVTSCVLPRFVVIFSFVPFAIGPSTTADAIPEFQRLQLFGSGHTLQTLSGEAVVARDTPYVCIELSSAVIFFRLAIDDLGLLPFAP